MNLPAARMASSPISINNPRNCPRALPRLTQTHAGEPPFNHPGLRTANHRLFKSDARVGLLRRLQSRGEWT